MGLSDTSGKRNPPGLGILKIPRGRIKVKISGDRVNNEMPTIMKQTVDFLFQGVDEIKCFIISFQNHIINLRHVTGVQRLMKNLSLIHI